MRNPRTITYSMVDTPDEIAKLLQQYENRIVSLENTIELMTAEKPKKAKKPEKDGKK